MEREAVRSSQRSETGSLLNGGEGSRVTEGTLIESEHFFILGALTAALSWHRVVSSSACLVTS